MLWAFGIGVGVGSGVGVGVGVGVEGDDAVGVLTSSELFGVATSDPCESEADPLHPNKNNTIVDMKICRYKDFIGQRHRNTYSSRKQMAFRHEKQLLFAYLKSLSVSYWFIPMPVTSFFICKHTLRKSSFLYSATLYRHPIVTGVLSTHEQT